MAIANRKVLDNFMESEIARIKYKEWIDKNKNIKEFSFMDWIQGFIDEYGIFAYDVKLEQWKEEDKLDI